MNSSPNIIPAANVCDLSRKHAVGARERSGDASSPLGECAAPGAFSWRHQTVYLPASGDEGVATTFKRRGVASTPTPTASFRLRACLKTRPVGAPGLQARPNWAISCRPPALTRRSCGVFKQALKAVRSCFFILPSSFSFKVCPPDQITQRGSPVVPPCQRWALHLAQRTNSCHAPTCQLRCERLHLAR